MLKKSFRCLGHRLRILFQIEITTVKKQNKFIFINCFVVYRKFLPYNTIGERTSSQIYNIYINIKPNCTIVNATMSRYVLLFALPIICLAKNSEHIRAISNPHETGKGSLDICKANDNCPLIGALDLTKIASDPITTQTGTFLGLVRKIVAGTEVI